MAEIKPKVAVLGGCGFIGREVVRLLIEQNAVESLMIVDKVPPQMAWLGPTHAAVFKSPLVKFKSANLINPASVQNVFDESLDWVINAAGETKLGLNKNIYEEGITKLSVNCAHAAAKSGVKIFVEISDGRMSNNEKIGHKETDPCTPWSCKSSCKANAEKQIQQINGLNWIIVRPGYVYGIGDRKGLASNLVVAAVYRHLQEEMKMLWNANLALNTIHVTDLARCILLLCQKGKCGEIYNAVDTANSTRGSLTDIVAGIFNIKYDFIGNIVSKMAKLDFEGVVSEANEKHLPPWAELCNAGGVTNTPLTPYVDSDVLQGHHLRLDGSKLAALGFKCQAPEPTREAIVLIIRELVDLNMFPKAAVPTEVLTN